MPVLSVSCRTHENCTKFTEARLYQKYGVLHSSYSTRLSVGSCSLQYLFTSIGRFIFLTMYVRSISWHIQYRILRYPL